MIAGLLIVASLLITFGKGWWEETDPTLSIVYFLIFFGLIIWVYTWCTD